ncbi:MAG: efflux RND transporter permease subunit [Candidatus Omnitrophota bacterium]
MIRRITAMILRLRWAVLLVTSLLTLGMAESLLRIQIDPSTDTLLDKNSQEYHDYQEMSRIFGSDNLIALAVSTPGLFEGEYLEMLRDLTEKVSQFSQVERVISLANAMDIRHRFLGVKVEPALKEVYEGGSSALSLQESILSNPLYRGNVVSEDGKVANIIIYLKPTDRRQDSHGTFIHQVRKLLRQYESRSVRFYLAGAPVEQYDFIRDIRRDQIVLIPIIAILLVLLTWMVYRDFSCVFFSMCHVFAILIWTMGTISWVRQEITLVTSLLAPVIMIICIVNSVHLMNLFFEVRMHHPSLKEAVLITMAQIGPPSFLAHLTTALGFLALLLNPVPGIRAFGLFAALGTCYSFIGQMILAPVLLPVLPYGKRTDDPESEHFFNRFLVLFLEELEFRGKWVILFITLVAFVISVMGLRRLEVDTSLMRQIKQDSELGRATRFIDEHMTGVYVMSFVFNKNDGSEMIDYPTLEWISDFVDFLEAKDEIAKVNSVTMLVKKINQARKNDITALIIPNQEGLLRKYFEGMMANEDPELYKIITPDLKQLRLEARVRAVGTAAGRRMVENIKAYLKEQLPEGLSVRVSGNILLMDRMGRDLVRNQMTAMIWAFLFILLVSIIVFRSLSLALIAALPNLLPILGIYGLMGFLGIELSTPTAMISNIVLGMVVNSSIHFIYRFRREFLKRHHYLQALHHTYRNVGQSLLISTVILCLGFGSSILGSFRPTVFLGLLISTAIFFALICILVVLPVCLVIVQPLGRERLFARRALH